VDSTTDVQTVDGRTGELSSRCIMVISGKYQLSEHGMVRWWIIDGQLYRARQTGWGRWKDEDMDTS